MKKILILGGDNRQLTVADEFRKSGYGPEVYCLGETNDSILSLSTTERYDIVITGLPTTRDGIHINAALSEIKQKIKDLKDIIRPGGYFFGSMLTPELTLFFKNNGITPIDYFTREELIIKNIVPTVEGAVAIAINESPITLHGSRCLVTGYGRLGKYLSEILKALGAEVDVSARNPRDLTWIAVNGYSPLLTASIKERIGRYDFIFNTIPATVIDDGCVAEIKKDALVIELASAPGGINKASAEKQGLKVITALSLPGRIAPVSAGKIIAKTLIDIIETEVGI